MFALITRHCTPTLVISAAMHKKAAKPFANICSLDTAIAIDGVLDNILWYCLVLCTIQQENCNLTFAASE